jgi:tRNA pseudouridine38-40 synthase
LQRIALLLEYSGKHFHGSQYQEGVRTVQAELERALAVLARKPVRAHLSGRTDAGVHARGQVVHVDVDDDWHFCAPLDEAGRLDLIWRLNGILARDISLTKICCVESNFHARYRAIEREYCYRILNRPQRSALLKDTYTHVRAPLHLEAMQEAAAAILGTHDFTAFQSSGSADVSPICSVKRSQILNLREGELEFWIAADHFVYNMVRIICGTLIDVGLGKRNAEIVSLALNSGDRNMAGPTAPALGLTLDSVKYPEAFKLWE